MRIVRTVFGSSKGTIIKKKKNREVFLWDLNAKMKKKKERIEIVGIGFYYTSARKENVLHFNSNWKTIIGRFFF